MATMARALRACAGGPGAVPDTAVHYCTILHVVQILHSTIFTGPNLVLSEDPGVRPPVVH